MRLTMEKASDLRALIEVLNDAVETIDDALETWMVNDGATDVDSRDERRNARDEIDGNIDQFAAAAVGLLSTFGYTVLVNPPE